MNKIFKVGLIGCGHISETYFRAEKYFNNIKIIKCADINHGNAVRCAKTYKIQALTVNELLKAGSRKQRAKRQTRKIGCTGR